MDEELNSYKQRHIRWQETTINQLGYANNILITLASGFLAFAFDKKLILKLSFSCDSVFSFKLFLIILSILFLITSIIYGLLATLTRLYDFRISRNIALTRQRYYVKYKKGLPDFSFKKPNFYQMFTTLLNIIFCPIRFIKKKHVKDIIACSIINEKFNDLRRQAYILGVLTWNLFKLQVFTFLISAMVYGLSLLF